MDAPVKCNVMEFDEFTAIVLYGRDGVLYEVIYRHPIKEWAVRVLSVQDEEWSS